MSRDKRCFKKINSLRRWSRSSALYGACVSIARLQKPTLEDILRKQNSVFVLIIFSTATKSVNLFLPLEFIAVTLILLTWRIWRAANNASKWQMGFNLAFKFCTYPSPQIYAVTFSIPRIKIQSLLFETTNAHKFIANAIILVCIVTLFFKFYNIL